MSDPTTYVLADGRQLVLIRRDVWQLRSMDGLPLGYLRMEEISYGSR